MSFLSDYPIFDYLKDEKDKKEIDKNKDASISSIEALALLLGLSFKDHPRKIFILFPSIYEAERFLQFIGDYVDDDSIFFFPYDEIFRSSTIGVSPEMSEERALALASIYDSKPSILIAHTSSFKTCLLSPSEYKKNLLSFHLGDTITIKNVINHLSRCGYTRVDSVTNASTYALRGGILDIYDPAYESPIRIEFFSDEIDDIRLFKVSDEKSFKHIKEIIIHPSSLKLLSEDEIKSGIEKINKSIKIADKEIKDRLTYDDLVERLETLSIKANNGNIEEIDSRFYSLFKDSENTLLNHLEEYKKFVYNPSKCFEEEKDILKKEKQYFSKAVSDGHSIKEEKVYTTSKLDLSCFSTLLEDENSLLVRDNSYKALSYIESELMIKQYLNDDYKIRVVLPEPNLSNFANHLSEKGIKFAFYPSHYNIVLLEGRLTKGFEIPDKKRVYLTSKEIFGAANQKSRFLSRYKEAKIIRKYDDLKIGDYVVHEIHGVGKYSGVITMDGLEYLKILYADDAVFYLPLSQYRLIRKYASREGYSPSLDKIGGSTWSRKKARIRARISYLADQLLSIYAERKNRPGYAFADEKELEKAFKEAFPFPYTESQLTAIDEVKKDMESNSPMDRLIAGDVGFGKTEVAFNAAFKCILSHKQVVLLCPTTLLSNQHYKVAQERFKDFGVKISLYNRFVPKNEQKKIIDSLKSGDIDFVIGTHGLLSDDIVFKDLGLLIIDEEQKFGVTHKEKIKEKAKNIDCLTLTATPIPRTMQMSLLGVRSMTILSEPPMNRMPIKTYVVKQDDDLIYEVIQKELDRKGQVYYLHNSISTIVALVNKLQKHFKNHVVKYVHAKMDSDEIENVMDDFYQCKINILVCTSIVESGLDIPNVNTIIVENADHFGLAQLYQIKGRVGRSDRLAYAYFFFKDELKMTEDGRKRLKALKDFTELGAGYKIAMQDLNIRGAGNILGSEQAGFVDSLGYDAYIDLLTTVIKEKELVNKAVDTKKNDFELSFSLDAHIPSDYGSESQRINMYKELSDCDDDNKIHDFALKLRDVYGPYPDCVSNLFTKKKIENYLNTSLYDSFTEVLGSYQIIMSEEFSLKSQIYKKLDELLSPLLVKLRVKVTSSHKFEFILAKTRDYLCDLQFLVESLKKAYDECK